MTDDLYTLDSEIAEARGWFVDDLGVWIEPQDEDESICDIWNRYTWSGGAVARWSENEPPPFSSSWALAGPLLEEMAAGDDVGGWGCFRDAGDWRAGEGVDSASEFLMQVEGRGATPCEAIARAWLAWYRSKA